MTQHAKKHITHNQEKNSPKQTDPVMTKIMKPASKNDVRDKINIVHMFKKEDEHSSIMKGKV